MVQNINVCVNVSESRLVDLEENILSDVKLLVLFLSQGFFGDQIVIFL